MSESIKTALWNAQREQAIRAEREARMAKREQFEAQRAEAIKQEQIEKCYRQYIPPQIWGMMDNVR